MNVPNTGHLLTKEGVPCQPTVWKSPSVTTITNCFTGVTVARCVRCFSQQA